MKKYFFSIIKKNNDELTQLFLTRSDLTVRSRVLDELYRSVEELSDKRKIAQWQLFVYHEEIKTLSPFHYKHRFMGMSFGFSCGEKQKAAEALIEFLKIEKGDFSLLVPHKKVLVNGSLGKITERLIEKGFLEKEASNVVACAETALKF